VGELLLGALAASALMPFVHAIVNKAGEDTYAKISELLARRARSRASAEVEESGSVTLVDPGCRVILRLPARLTPDEAVRISDVMVSGGSGWYLVSWDEQVKAWRVTVLAQPPSYGLDVTGDVR
jgi:hypothetical protein